MEKKKTPALAFFYLKQGLDVSERLNNEPIKNSFLLALDDFTKNKISKEEFSDIARSLFDLHFFTRNLHNTDPQLWMAFDLAAVLKTPRVDRSHQETDVKVENALTGLSKFLNDNTEVLIQIRCLTEL